MHIWKKQPFLSVLTGLNYMGKCHQSARLRFWEPLRSFWGCVISGHLYVISRLERLCFFVCFPGACCLLIPLVSVLLEVLREPLSSLLFSLASRYLIYASSISVLSHVRQKPVPQAAFWKAGLCDVCFTVPFSNKGEAIRWALVPSCSELCQFPFAVLQGLWCCHKLLTCFALCSPQASEVCCFLISALSYMR